MDFLKTAVLINDTSTKAHLGCRVVVGQIARLAAASGIRITATSSVHADWREHPRLMERMRAADLVIVNGEGTLHDSTRQAMALAAVGPFCRDAGVPSALVNSVYERNDGEIAAACAAFDRVYVRETSSARAAQAAGLPAAVVPDLTLSSDVMAPFRARPRGAGLAVTDNANRSVGGPALEEALRRQNVSFLHLDTSEPHNPFMDAALAPEVVFMNTGEVPVPPAPAHRKPVSAFRAFRKSLFKPQLTRRMRMLDALSAPLSATQILNRIATSNGLVGGRFHAVCMAMLSDTPFAAMSSNTSKMRGMLTDAGVARFLTDDPIAAFDLPGRWTEADRTAVAAYIARARREARAMFDDIASLA